MAHHSNGLCEQLKSPLPITLTETSSRSRRTLRPSPGRQRAL